MPRNGKSRQESRADDRWDFQRWDLNQFWEDGLSEGQEEIRRELLAFDRQWGMDGLYPSRECFYCGCDLSPAIGETTPRSCRCVAYSAGGEGCGYGCDYCSTKHLWDDYDSMKREEREQDEGLRILELLGWKMGA